MIESTSQITVRLIQWGNDVTRWHTTPTVKSQTLAGHSWGVAMLVMSLFNGDPMDKLVLLQAALEHDLAEKEIGDMPRAGRTDEHHTLERERAAELHVFHDSMLPQHLHEWFKWADLIEAGLHCLREVQFGNQNYMMILHHIRQNVDKNREKMPPDLWRFCVDGGLSL
jgi:5'-deoxynucleotidase YfbR-like HD superfamily hydrolase